MVRRHRWSFKDTCAAAALATGIGALSAAPAAHANDLVSGSLTVDWVSEYVFRGGVEENSGAIVQPELSLSFDVHEHANIVGGVWASLHSKHTDAGEATGADAPGLRAFYELDWWAGVETGYERIGVEMLYTEFTSPAGAFDRVQEISVGINYDDTDLLIDGLGLHPHVLVAVPVSSGDDGVYLELGIEPGFPVDLGLADELAITFPVTVGFGFDDYYPDDATFGFVSVGARGTMPLTLLGDDGWAVTAGLDVIFPDSRINADHSGPRFVGMVGLGIDF